VNNTTFLSLPAVDAIAGMLAEIYASNSQVIDILTNWSTGTVQAAESTYTVTSNALSVGGMVGQYTGNVVIPYVKRNLNNLMPYPFVFPWAYPTNMATLETFFLETFNIVLEDGEFAVTGNSISGPLSGSNGAAFVRSFCRRLDDQSALHGCWGSSAIDHASGAQYTAESRCLDGPLKSYPLPSSIGRGEGHCVTFLLSFKA
jgi:hypothetical protein